MGGKIGIVLSMNGSSWRKAPRRWLSRLVRRGKGSTENQHFNTLLAVQLELERAGDKAPKSLLLTSATSQSLIREAGADLAYTLAERLGQRVLVIDTSFVEMDETGVSGVTDLLVEGPDRLESLTRTTSHANVFSLPLGDLNLAATSVRRGRHSELIDKARENYDCVILLGAPVLRNSRWLVFAPLVDYSLLLAVEGRTYVNDIEASLRALAECKASGVGIVLAKPPRGFA